METVFALSSSMNTSQSGCAPESTSQYARGKYCDSKHDQPLEIHGKTHALASCKEIERTKPALIARSKECWKTSRRSIALPSISALKRSAVCVLSSASGGTASIPDASRHKFMLLRLAPRFYTRRMRALIRLVIDFGLDT